MGAFGSRDSLLGDAADPATLNRYAYAEGNPVASCDPTGHVTKRRYDPRLSIQKPLATIRKKSKAPGGAARIGAGKVVADIASRTTRAVSAAVRYGKATAGKSVVAKGARVVAAVPPPSFPEGLLVRPYRVRAEAEGPRKSALLQNSRAPLRQERGGRRHSDDRVQ